MKFGLPPWLKRDADVRAVGALVKYVAPPAADPTVDPTDAEALNGWTPETLTAYHAESEARAMAVVAASMEGRLKPRPRWANSKYSPFHWRGLNHERK